MARWLVEIKADPIDLEEYPRWFPTGDVFAIQQGQRVYLTGGRFDRAGGAEAVRLEAGVALRELFGVVTLLWPPARLPSVGNVEYQHDDGRRDSYVAVGSAEMRAKSSGLLSVGGQTKGPQLTQGQALYSAA